jgi:hypothetical protein
MRKYQWYLVGFLIFAISCSKNAKDSDDSPTKVKPPDPVPEVVEKPPKAPPTLSIEGIEKKRKEIVDLASKKLVEVEEKLFQKFTQLEKSKKKLLEDIKKRKVELEKKLKLYVGKSKFIKKLNNGYTELKKKTDIELKKLDKEIDGAKKKVTGVEKKIKDWISSKDKRKSQKKTNENKK